MTVEAVLAAHPSAVEALANGDQALWERLLDHLVETGPEAAPTALVQSMLQRDPALQGWIARARDAAAEARSEWHATVTAALRAFIPWLTAGVIAACGADAPAALHARFERVLRNLDDDDLVGLRALVADVARVLPGDLLHGRALLLLARRAAEQDLHEDAAAAAAEARAVLPGDAAERDEAVRREAAAWLALERFDVLLPRLDDVLATRGPLFGGFGTHVFRVREDARADALDEAATVLMWARAETPEWVRALGGLAERLGDGPHGQALASRFRVDLERMVDASPRPVEDLEVVARQAAQRGLTATVAHAVATLAARFADAPDAAEIIASYGGQGGSGAH